MINSVLKAIKILQILSDADGKPVTLDKLCTLTGYNKSTCVHILNTLISENMAEHISRREGYALGYGTFLLSRFGQYSHQIASVTHPILKWLTKKTGQTSLVCVFSEKRRIRIDYVNGEFGLLSNNQQIFVETAHDSATGLILVAHLPYEKRELYIENLRKENNPDITDEKIEKFISELDVVKSRGYSENFSNDGDRTLRGFAAPIFKNKKCVAAIGLAYHGDRNKTYLKHMLTAAKEITRRLDFN